MNDSDPDAAVTIPIDKLAMLRAAAKDARIKRDAIENCCSPAWAEAHMTYKSACEAADEERWRLARNPKTRYGSWRTPADVELMVLGLI